VGGVLVLRAREQLRRDQQRVGYVVAFPRTLTDDQVRSFLQTLIGLAVPRLGIVGRDSAVLEVVGTREGLRHRLYLPKASSRYFVGQLRAAVPGVAVTPIDRGDAALSLVTHARELRLTDPTRALADSDAGAVAKAVLAASTGLMRGEITVWQLTNLGGTPQGRGHRQHLVAPGARARRLDRA
jgi:hypothetical protein